MGRKSPWSKEYLKKLYFNIDTYCKVATLHALRTEDQKVAMETLAAYNMFKYPVVYIYIHYHFGDFEDLEMQGGDISSYMIYLSMVKEFTQDFITGMLEKKVFDFDKDNVITPSLIDICKEVIFIENNF